MGVLKLVDRILLGRMDKHHARSSRVTYRIKKKLIYLEQNGSL